MRPATGSEKIIKATGNGTGEIIDLTFDNGERLRVEADLLYELAHGHLANFLAGDVDNGRWVLRATWRKERKS